MGAGAAEAGFFAGVFFGAGALFGVSFLGAEVFLGAAGAFLAAFPLATGAVAGVSMAVAEGGSGTFLGGTIAIGSLAERFLVAGAFLGLGVDLGVALGVG